MALLTLTLPVVLFQARRLQRTALRLPAARAPLEGTCGTAAETLGLLVLGESTAAGVGARDHERALAGRLAARLAERLGARVSWRALGINGFDARATREHLLPQSPARGFECVVIVLGVNDVLALHTPARWLRDLAALIDAVRRRHAPRLVTVCGVPPVGCFPAIPAPLRGVFGGVATALERATARWCAGEAGVLHAPVSGMPTDQPALFCADGFHPSERGYELWAEDLAARMAAALARPDDAAARDSPARAAR